MKDGEGSGLSDDAPSRVPTAALSGLPLALVMTNPSFEDNPIVYANPAFARLTGYTLESVIGKNCRLLQGPATEPDRVARHIWPAYLPIAAPAPVKLTVRSPAL